MVALRTDSEKIIPRYLLFALQGRDVQHQIGFNEGTGSTVSNMRIPVLKGLDIPVPDLSDQKVIAHILGTLDDKIELNQKMNQTLEDIARAIFKSWFVDFDPVRAKAEGRPTGLSPEISDLFPDALVDSEIGEIPKGWEVKTISDLADCIGGATPSTKNSEFWEGGHHTWTSPKDLSNSKSVHLLKTDRKITEAGLKKISSGLLPTGTVLLSSRAPVGYLALTTEPTAINQGYIALQPRSGISNYFLLHWCECNLDEIKNRASGTTFAEISKTAFRPIPAIEPSDHVMQKFHEFVAPIYERVLISSKEMETLAELRDTLLPKLISGELRIPDAGKFLEEAGI
jgi:type I restriction enzyme S subunit